MNADNELLKNLNKFPACTLDSTEDIIFNTVSFRILLCVFLPQMGQIIHSVCIFESLLVFLNILPVGII